MMKILFLFLICFRTLQAEDYSGKEVMNGHRLTDYKNFEKKWKLVTVRFRKDTAEMRLTYANKIAYKSLMKGVTDYPDGAVFAKIGLKTQEDSAFPSSAVPQGARRYQFMVRNKKKYAETNGWSYALFDERGLTFPEEPKNQTMACAACHNAVPERGYVFSQPMELHARDITKNSKIKKTTLSNLLFKTIETSLLPKAIADLLPAETKYIRVLEGEMKKYLFQGTLEEIRPALSTEVESSRFPAILYNEEGTRFSLVIPENPGANCLEENKSGIFMKSIYSTYNPEGSKSEKTLHYCFTR
jgi:hypothetical protein